MAAGKEFWDKDRLALAAVCVYVSVYVCVGRKTRSKWITDFSHGYFADFGKFFAKYTEEKRQKKDG